MKCLPLCPRKGAELSLAAIALLLAACGPAAPPPDVVATYRGGEVTLAELEAARLEVPAAEAPDAPDAPDDRRLVALHEAVLREALAAEAPADDPQLAAAVEQAREQVLRLAMADELGWNRLAVDEATVRRLYDEHPQDYHDPEKLRLQHIFLRAEEGTLSAAERAPVAARLAALRQEALAGADFAELARRHSQSATANGGGWMILKPGDAVFPAFVDAAWDLAPGGISDVVDTPHGFHLIKLAARIAPLSRPYEEVREFVRQRAVELERAARQAAFIAEAGERHGLERRYERLRDPLLPPDEALLRFADGEERTFADLAQALPDTYQPHLYNRRFDEVVKFLDGLAVAELLVREAERRGLAERPATAAQIARATAAMRYDYALQHRLARRVDAVPEEELRGFFEQNSERYKTLRTTTLRVILLDLEPDEHPWNALQRGERLVAELRAGADFGELARRHSRHYSARDGGRLAELTDHGIGRLVQTRARNRQIIEELEIGEISDPFLAEVYLPDRLRFVHSGVYIVQVEDRRLPEQARFEDVSDAVRANYLRRHYQRLLGEVRDEALAELDLVVHADRLPPV